MMISGQEHCTPSVAMLNRSAHRQLSSTMTRTCLLLGLIFHYVSKAALSEPTTWLMQGDMLTEDEATSRLIQLDSYNSYFSVTTRAEVFYAAQPGKFISCVIAAAVYQNGHVSVVEGGYGSGTVRVRYVTRNGETDVFAVFLQTATRQPVSVDGSFVNSTRVGLVYEPASNWTRRDVESVLRNVNADYSLRRTSRSLNVTRS